MWRLRLEVGSVVKRARAWAEQRGLPVDPLSEGLAADAGADECIEAVRRLAQTLRSLGSRAWMAYRREPQEAAKTMREVLLRLRSENAEAALEFDEFNYAIREVLRHLEALGGALKQLHSDIAAILVSEDDPNGLQALCTVEDNSDRLSATCEQLVMAFRQICNAIDAWSAIQARST